MTSSLMKSSSLESLKRGVSYKRMRSTKFVWIIRNFSFYTEETGEKLESPSFQSERYDDDGIEWCLDLYPRGVIEEDKDYLSLYLRLVSKKPTETVAKFEFCIWNVQGEKSHMISSETPQEFKTDVNDKFGFPQFVSRSCLLDKDEQLLLNDRLTIFCQIEYTTSSHHASFKPKAVQLPYEEETDVLVDLFSSKAFSDVTFCVNGKEFPAHKAVMATKSPIFAAMLNSNLNEGPASRIDITDISPEAFEKMLIYVYNGDADDIESVAEELLSVADKYQLSYLKAVCEEQLFNRLTIENVAQYLILADIHSAVQLKQLAIDFFNENAVDVVKTEGWKELIRSHVKLLPDIYIKSIQN